MVDARSACMTSGAALDRHFKAMVNLAGGLLRRRHPPADLPDVAGQTYRRS